ncbi:transcriptional regulator QRICH1-like isoform X1 [Pristis pectinata]|uniref:transcriptional regulator QRICH1-like isoform X1 n=1 Tax=Pristis pectinata TaxID=685728 RepID=UPI00223DEEA6|nr:transcriptional regulator QRICH1-like isoform X1 [Pristis pectinata]XP_051889738.1 transcriptional regulator QRICH1-like isoform X1 [Pristis pectinata]XP_051889739.1 transcriptional regulator QRICH1-like isoform X1 [Pristis pectinata]XP_051889740.1 transcriptional regulator QRICH1-like isoform X1 [Pristis pectinata]XP_051889741.1 transcriptional regulator QRICH1-like isoform X1 [Pristis pectinata]
MNHSLENSIPYEEYLRMKARTIPQHHMKEFLDSVNGKGSEEVQQFVQTPVTMYQQRGHYIYMDSADVAGSLLELSRPISSPVQQHTAQGSPIGQQMQSHPVQAQQPHQLEIQTDHQTLQAKQMQAQLQSQTTSEEPQSVSRVINSLAQERRPSSSGVPQPVKKRKVDLPVEENYTMSQPLVQNTVTTVLTLPSQVQQQSYIPVRQELLTVDSSQLYSVVPATTSTSGPLSNAESWTIYTTPAPCSEGQTVLHTTIPHDGCNLVQIDEIPMNVTGIKIEEGKDKTLALSNAGKSQQDKMIHPSVTTAFSTQFVNVNGNLHIPVTIQAGGRTYQSLKYWDPQQVQTQAMHTQSTDHQIEVQADLMLPDSLKPEEGASVWQNWAQIKNAEIMKEAESKPPLPGRRQPMKFREDALCATLIELNYGLCLMTKEARDPDGAPYEADLLYYFFLCIQKHMFENGRIDNIFADLYYSKFTERLHEVLKEWHPKISLLGYVIPSRITEEMLWDCKQLGAHSPATLLYTLMYFNTKYFMLKTVEQHSKLAFSKVLKQMKKNPGNSKDKCSSIRYLRLYGQLQAGQKVTEDMYVEQLENSENPLRCPIKLYDFYLFKCPQSAKGRNDAFYLNAEPVVAPNSPIWYSTQPVSNEAMEQMLTRILMIREVQEACANTHIPPFQ